ncbi:MAG: TIGR01212 family radical SAM protein [Candidatus Omnitrophica bacterium]|nr:TIGR01212 family radical SAM protein [Candidatus Omnitrophota bacterium]
MEERFFSYNRYLRDKFSQRVQRISIDAGFSCPNLDGTLSTSGCAYCNNKAFVKFAGSNKSVREQILSSLDFYGRRFKVKKFIAYFQSFSNTHADVEQLGRTYEIIRDFPQIVGLSVSTRPDCIDKNKLKLISSFCSDYLVWIEYGLQTTNDILLASINRGHTYEDFLNTLELSKKFNLNIGVHMIVGLPGSQYLDHINDARRLASLKIQGIKFHAFHVLKETVYEGLYSQGKIALMQRQDYVKTVCDMLEFLPQDLVILRLVPSAYHQYLIAPDWINDKAGVIDQIGKRLQDKKQYQGRLYENTSHKS